MLILPCQVFFLPSKLINWNVCGLNSRARQDTVRTLITSCQAEIVCLHETKMSGIPRGCILSLLSSEFSYWMELPSIGASGGILVAWRQGLCPASATQVDNLSISIQFSPGSSQAWWLTCVYGPQGDDHKILFLQELRDVQAACL